MDEDLELDPQSWTTYDEFVTQYMTDDDLLEHFQIQGPGPPGKSAVHNFPPPPPIPGTREECLVFSSHFDTCSSLKVNMVYAQLCTVCIVLSVSCTEREVHQHSTNIYKYICRKVQSFMRIYNFANVYTPFFAYMYV